MAEIKVEPEGPALRLPEGGDWWLFAVNLNTGQMSGLFPDTAVLPEYLNLYADRTFAFINHFAAYQRARTMPEGDQIQ